MGNSIEKSNLLLLSRSVQFWRIISGIFEKVFINVLVFFVDDVRDGKIPFQSINLLPELCFHVGHIGPLLGLVEEIWKTKFAAPEKSGE